MFPPAAELVILQSMQCAMLYVTAKDEAAALTLGRSLVEERLVACANVLGGMTSIFWWQGAVEQGQEAVLLLKTRADLVDAATARICALHEYEVPCVVSWPLRDGNPDYLAWVAGETGSPETGTSRCHPE